MLYPIELRGRNRTREWLATPEGIMPHLASAREGSCKSGVGNGNRTRNRRSHSPVLCQLSYSHRRSHYTTALPEMSEPGVRRSAGFISKQEFHRPVGAVSLPGQEAAAPGTQKLTQAGEREAEEKHREAVESSREKNGR